MSRTWQSGTLVILRARLAVSAIVAAVLLPIVAIVSYSRARIDGGRPTDYLLFGPAGADILRGRWDLVYASAQNAGGPFELVPFGIARLLALDGVAGWTIFYTCTIAVLVFLFCVVVAAPLGAIPMRSSFWLTLPIAGVAVVANVIPSAVYGGHPAEMMIPLLWLLGAMFARDRQFAAAGILIGLSVGFESWGVLGFVLVFVASKPRLIRAAVAFIVTIVAIYGPFLATGVFRLVAFHWRVSSQSFYGVFFPHLDSFPWSLRVVQAMVACGAGIGTLLLSRRTPYAIWLSPLAIVAGRLVLDPLLFDYYWLAATTVVLSTLVCAIYSRQWIPVCISAALLIWFWFPRSEPLVCAMVLAAVVSVCAAVLHVAGRHRSGDDAAALRATRSRRLRRFESNWDA